MDVLKAYNHQIQRLKHAGHVDEEIAVILGSHGEDFEAMICKAYWDGVRKARSDGASHAERKGGAQGIKQLIFALRLVKRKDDEEEKKMAEIRRK